MWITLTEKFHYRNHPLLRHAILGIISIFDNTAYESCVFTNVDGLKMVS